MRFCKMCSGWHDLSEPWPLECARVVESRRSDAIPVPMIMTDGIEPTRSHADGRLYTSKSALRATYKPSGNPEGKSFVEVGTEYDKPGYVPPQPKIDAQKIDETLHRAMARYEAGERPA